MSPLNMKGDNRSSRIFRILIFSPDFDLAKSMALLLEKQFEIDFVTRLDHFQEKILAVHPDVLLVDLFTFEGEIAKLLVILQASKSKSPIIFLRGYRQWIPEIEEAITNRGTMIFYKPIEMHYVVEAILRLTNGGINRNIPIVSKA